jgi:3-hydroxyisobutyrate dehydrogenase-like beta-hydroxyacid dehydrogenase
MTTLGILHPGAMGSSVGAAARAGGAKVIWCGVGRSTETRKRAEQDGLVGVGSLEQLTRESDVIVSVCPPDAAHAQAEAVARFGFGGLYVDANAISRNTAVSIEALMRRAGASFVDAGILGPPARAGQTTLLCLSGARAPEVAELFRGSALEPKVVGEAGGQASALKMAFAAWTKGSSALLLAVRALAAAEGVEAALLESWARLSPELTARSERAAVGAAPKAWRWVGEMLEIARSFEAVGLPGDFHEGAAQLYARLGTFNGEQSAPRLGAVVAALLSGVR